MLQYLPGGNLKAWCERNPSILSDPRLHYESWGRSPGSPASPSLDVLGGGRRAAPFPAEPVPLDPAALEIGDTCVRNERLWLREAAVRAGSQGPLVNAIDAAVAAFDRRRPTLAERLRLEERLRVAHDRWRFRRDCRYPLGRAPDHDRRPPGDAAR